MVEKMKSISDTLVFATCKVSAASVLFCTSVMSTD